MSDVKLSGCCTLCDEPVFEVVARWQEGERHAGEPRRLGPPLDHARRITFLLLDGSTNDLTFCASCMESLTPAQYPAIWQKNLRSWQRELNEKPGSSMTWLEKQFGNGLLCELVRKTWKELI